MDFSRRELIKGGGLTPAAGIGTSPFFSSQPPDLANLGDISQQMSRQGETSLSLLNPGWKSVDQWKQKAHIHQSSPTQPGRQGGIPEQFQGTFCDVPHSFRPDMQDDAFAWIEKWI